MWPLLRRAAVFGGIDGEAAASLPSRGVYRSTNFFGGAPSFSKLAVFSGGSGNRAVTD